MDDPSQKYYLLVGLTTSGIRDLVIQNGKCDDAISGAPTQQNQL